MVHYIMLQKRQGSWRDLVFLFGSTRDIQDTVPRIAERLLSRCSSSLIHVVLTSLSNIEGAALLCLQADIVPMVIRAVEVERPIKNCDESRLTHLVLLGLRQL